MGRTRDPNAADLFYGDLWRMIESDRGFPDARMQEIRIARISNKVIRMESANGTIYELFRRAKEPHRPDRRRIGRMRADEVYAVTRTTEEGVISQYDLTILAARETWISARRSTDQKTIDLIRQFTEEL